MTDTAHIMDKCRTLPGVTMAEGPECTELRLYSPEGEGLMRFYPMFDGITTALISVNAPSWPAPKPDHCAPDAKGPLIINYCMRGRCELVLNDKRHVFLSSGEISLTERFAQNEYIYPGRLYEGIEIFIDPETRAEPLRELFGLDLESLRRKYCPDGDTFIAKAALSPELLERLGAHDEASAHMKTAVVDLLMFLQSDAGPTMRGAQPVYYTRSQVEIAKKTEQIICADLSKQHTVREFAELFSVSESSIKNYFSGVFGQSISRYTTHRRMVCAAELLTQTSLSVIEVAGRVGYLNQSKFSAAFRRAYSRSPLEYRREKKLDADF